MGTPGEQNEIQDNLRGMASHLLKEVIQADMSMHQAQIKAWQWFATHLPKGELINDDLGDGMPRNMYLALNDLSMTFHIKPRPLTFWKRLSLAVKILGKHGPVLTNHPGTYELTSAADSQAVKVNIAVSRFKNGTVQAKYGPVDEVTADLLKTV